MLVTFIEVINVVLQVFLFTLIPILFYWIKERKWVGIYRYLGFKKCELKLLTLPFLFALLLSSIFIFFIVQNNELYQLMINPNTVTGKLKTFGFSASTLSLLVLTAFGKTALAEEILFRGFIAKQLIAQLGYKIGNTIQACIFGGIHVLLFLNLTSNFNICLLILIFTGIVGYIGGYLNELRANGSILPSIIMHSTSNIISYLIISFVL